MCNNAEMRQFRITYKLKVPNSASIQDNEGIGKQSVCNNAEMRVQNNLQTEGTKFSIHSG